MSVRKDKAPFPLWLSPHCLPTSAENAGLPLFAALDQLTEEETP